MILVALQSQLQRRGIGHPQGHRQGQRFLGAGLRIRKITQLGTSHPHGVKNHGLRVTG